MGRREVVVKMRNWVDRAQDRAYCRALVNAVTQAMELVNGACKIKILVGKGGKTRKNCEDTQLLAEVRNILLSSICFLTCQLFPCTARH